MGWNINVPCLHDDANASFLSTTVSCLAFYHEINFAIACKSLLSSRLMLYWFAHDNSWAMSCYVTWLSCRLSMIFLIGIFFLRTILLAGHMAVYFNLNTEALRSFGSICTLLHQICLNLTAYLLLRYFVDLNKEKLIMKKHLVLYCLVLC